MTAPGIRVLYVDDDHALVRLIERTLGRRGFVVEHAGDAAAALARLAGGGIDVIALDHNLPTGTGIDLLGRLAALPGTPAVVYVTGSAEMDIAVAALKAGADDFVPKTVGDDFLVLLAAALEQAVEKSRLRAARDAAEREVLAGRDRAQVMLREMNHRIANSLTLISSFVSLQSNVLTDQAARSALAETQARIYAISLVHRRLYTSDDVRSVDVKEYLDSLLEHLRGSLQSDAHGARLMQDIAPLRLPTDTAISLGVVVTELVTNAFKYAYPGAGVGEVRVTLAPDGEALRLEVDDDGIGWDGQGPVQGTGLGGRIVKAMAGGLAGEITYDSSHRGTRARLRFTPPATP